MNTIIESIKGFQQYFIPGTSFKTETKNQFKKFVEELRDDDTFDVDNDVVNELISILEKKTINKQLKESIKQKTELLLSKLDENNKLVCHDTDCEIVGNTMKIDAIEKELDNAIDNYNKYTEKNPMLGVTWNDKLKKWDIKNKFYNVNTNRTTLENATKLITDKISLNSNKQIIQYSLYKTYNNLLVSYIYNNIELFDIYHIIKFTGVKNVHDKYGQFKDKVSYYGFKKNEYGGYNIKKFITKEIMVNIIHSSNKIQTLKLANSIGMEIKNYYISKEQQILNCITCAFDGEEIEDQKYIGNYRIDLYFTKYDIAVECDENNHKDRNKIHELERENHIKNTLHCKFIRFNPDDENFNIHLIINSIFKEIMNYKKIDF